MGAHPIVANDTSRPPSRGVAGIVFAALIGVWAVAITAVMQTGTWLVEQFLVIEGIGMPSWAWPVAAWINAALVGVPALILAYAASRRDVQAVGRAWTIAAALLGLLGSVRAVPAQSNELYLLVLAAVAAAVTLGLRLFARRVAHARFPRKIKTVPWYAVAAGLAVGLPWLWVGALGGVVETVLALLAAAGVGVLAAEVLTARWLDAPFANLGTARLGRIVLAALVGGVSLVLIAAGTGGSGVHLTEMLLLPPLAFAGAALTRIAAHRRPVAVVVGLAILGPLALVEPDETSLALGLHDVGFWTGIGALGALGIGLATIPVALASLARPVVRWRFAAPVAAMAMVAAGAVVYPVAGHPGFFGEHLFVVMKQQADLSGLAQITDRDERLRTTYQRLVDTANRSQAPLRAELRKWHLGYTPYYLVNGIEVDAGPAVRAWLSGRGDVDRVLLNPTLRPIPSAGPPIRGHAPAPTGPVWNVALVDAPPVWASGDTGQGIVIGGSDTGVDLAHPAVRAAFRGGDDSWYDPWNHTTSPVDHNGHGTHTIGSALGANGIGVAPGAQWMACVNLDRNLGSPAHYLDCLQFMLAPFGAGGDAFHGNPGRAADVLTNSWGCPTMEGCDRDALRPAVDALTAAGIFFVAAAGNEGPRCESIDDAPAPYPDTFTVGAVDKQRRVTDFSSRGPVPGGAKPDVVAPGADVVSALPGGGYGALDGTSMATPQVAGVVALMWAASPVLRGDVPRTAQILRDTATPATATAAARCGGTEQTGAGLVNAAAAVAAAKAAG
jgi:subtilisin family serine protease